MARPVRRPGNLPAEATSFIGRHHELAQVRKTFAEARLVSLVGPGGVGKTRLAVRAATDLRRGLPGGAWLVELAETRDPAFVGHAVMSALELRDQAATEPLPLVLSYLQDKRLLLVMDNCEHLLAATARLLTQILRGAPEVRVIATSREPLSVQGEHVIAVAPLELPSAAAAEPIARVRQNEAVMLFTQRAAAGSGNFELTAANQAAVVGVCRRLDGLPLAIELAAVRTRFLTAEQILDRLADRFGLLTGGGEGVLPRHQTLRTTIDWSHDLLVAEERAVLRRLSVFAGRFTLEDVESICGSDVVPAAAVLELLSSLVDKSLVDRDGTGGLACFRLHETMREYAALRLREADEGDSVEARFDAYYVTKCQRSFDGTRAGLLEWLEWMDMEIDNVRSVLRRCLAQQDGLRGLGLVSSLGWYWATRATSEGVRWFDALFASVGGNGQPHAVGYFLRGFLAVLQSDPANAGPALDRAATAAHEIGHDGLRSQSLAMGSIAAHMAGDRATARRLLDAAHVIAAGGGDYPTTIALLQARALGGLFAGDLDAVTSAASEGVRLSREAGDLHSLEMMLMNLGCASLVAGDLDTSKPLCTESLRIARQIDDRVAQFCLLAALGCHAGSSGQPRLAAQLFGAAQTVQTSVGAGGAPFLDALLIRAEESATVALGTAGFQAEFEAGKRLSRTAAIGLALGESGQRAASSTHSDASPLGNREAQVAHLVADGLSNRQIGARLFISEHTVNSHVRNILNKLGFTSRTQIATWHAGRATPCCGPCSSISSR